MDWQECNDNDFVKEVVSDKSLVKSLLESSDRKIKSNEMLVLNEITSSTKVGIVYDALREVLEAVAIEKGFKIYNHDCYCAFLDEVCKDKRMADEFDRFRRIRNQINYYGKNILLEEARDLINSMVVLRKQALNKFFH